MIPYKNRKVHWGKPARVYRNLNLPKKEGWYSITQQFDKLDGGKGWLVVAHAQNLVLEDCVFKVSQAGRRRVLREQSKNVHAIIHGTLRSSYQVKLGDNLKDFTYNPYKFDNFVNKTTERPISGAFRVIINKFELKYQKL